MVDDDRRGPGVLGLAIKEDESLRRGVNVYKGKLNYKAVANALNLDYTPLEL